jgi:hypothetical protein
MVPFYLKDSRLQYNLYQIASMDRKQQRTQRERRLAAQTVTGRTRDVFYPIIAFVYFQSKPIRMCKTPSSHEIGKHTYGNHLKAWLKDNFQTFCMKFG